MPAASAGLLGELAGGGGQRLLVLDVEQPGGQLVEPAADRVAVLLHEQHAAVLVERDHADRARVHDVVALARAAAGHGDLVLLQR